MHEYVSILPSDKGGRKITLAFVSDNKHEIDPTSNPADKTEASNAYVVQGIESDFYRSAPAWFFTTTWIWMSSWSSMGHLRESDPTRANSTLVALSDGVDIVLKPVKNGIVSLADQILFDKMWPRYVRIIQNKRKKYPVGRRWIRKMDPNSL